MSHQLSLILGGVRSGKSAFAEKLVRELEQSTLYLATGQAIDAEMEERIRQHRIRRPGSWTTLEEPLDLAGALDSELAVPDAPKVILVDSLDVWVGNLLLHHEQEPFPCVKSAALTQLERLLQVCDHATTTMLIVSSEVGLSPIPPNRLGRHFQDLLGLVNQRVAAVADLVYLVVAGIPVEIKGPALT